MIQDLKKETDARSIEMNPTKNTIPAEKRKKMVELLNQGLADLLALQLQCKQAHWNVKGPSFIGLHELFDSVYDAISEQVDEVAERAVALGGIADGRIATIAEKAHLKPYPIDITSGRDHVDALSSAIAEAGKYIRTVIDKADEAGDADTADLFTDVSRVLDKKLWFVEAHLQGEK